MHEYRPFSASTSLAEVLQYRMKSDIVLDLNAEMKQANVNIAGKGQLKG